MGTRFGSVAPMGDVAGRTVLITGAAGGIGAATARELVSAGARVALVDLDAAGVATVASELGDAAWHAVADVTVGEDLAAAAAETIERFGRIDAVIVNAAINHIARVDGCDGADFDRVIAVNLGGALRTVQATLPHLLDSRGYILLVCSGAGLVQGPFQAPYNASKAGLHALGNTLRHEVRGQGVQVGIAYLNAIATDTAIRSMNHPLMAPLDIQAMMTPRPVEEVAKAVTRAIGKRSRVIYVPRSASLAAASPALLQRATDRWVSRRLKRHHGTTPDTQAPSS